MATNNFIHFLSVCLLLAGAPPEKESDLSQLVDEVIVESGTNISIGCPGITRNTFVVQLEWRCVGQCGDAKKPGKKMAAFGEHSLLKYVKDQGEWN
jgi:hypothetical protein